MQLPEEYPSLPKLPFLVGDALLLLTAVFIASRSDGPLDSPTLLAICACVGLGTILAVIPFLVDYARRQEESLDQRQQTLATLARQSNAAAEQISIAAGSLPALTQHTAQAAKLADQLPKLIQDKIHQLREGLSQADNTEIENLRRELFSLRSAEIGKLEAAIDKIGQTATRLDELLARWEQLPAQTEAAARELQSTLKAATKPARAPKPPPSPQPESTAPAAPDPEKSPEPEPASADATPNAPSVPEDSSPAPDQTDVAEIEKSPTPALKPAPGAKPPPRRKAPPPIDDNPDLFEATPPPDDEPAETATALSADGATRLIVTAYIGIGNKLYIRGDGPGLHPEQGVPLQFVSIGKWRWETGDATAPINIRLYKNDQIECSNHRGITLQPAHQHEVSASF